MKQLILIITLVGAFLTSSVGYSTAQEKVKTVQKKKTIPPAGTEKAVYTCPMHPEVIKDKPGTCPKCGMDLVKKETKKIIYTCPMHPEVKQDKPGTCPKCGMDLVKKDDIKKDVPRKQ